MEFDVIIIGGGIVGLSTAWNLIHAYPDLSIGLLEKEPDIAKHQTGNNSGVIHSGIYYKPKSLKAKLCTEGKEILIDFCEQNQIPYRFVSKLIAATDHSQFPTLDTLFQRGKENGLENLRTLVGDEIREIEPCIRAKRAIYNPKVGIVNYKQVCRVLSRKLSDLGVKILTDTKMTSCSFLDNRLYIETVKQVYKAKFLVNCAGLYSDHILRLVEPKKTFKHQIIPFRGEYYKLNKEAQPMIKGLVYPVPDPRFPFLGVHLTKMIDGIVEAGPNAVLALAKEGYHWKNFHLQELWQTLSFSGFWKFAFKHWKIGAFEMKRSLSKKTFCQSLQKFLPDLEPEQLIPGGAGVRAQLIDQKGRLCDDFVIQREYRSFHVLNAPSPAATASFAIGASIVKQMTPMLEEYVLTTTTSV